MPRAGTETPAAKKLPVEREFFCCRFTQTGDFQGELPRDAERLKNFPANSFQRRTAGNPEYRREPIYGRHILISGRLSRYE